MKKKRIFETTSIRLTLLISVTIFMSMVSLHQSTSWAACTRTPLLTPAKPTVTVSNVSELRHAMKEANATGNVTILIKDGIYELGNRWICIRGDNITLRSLSGDRDAVTIQGHGMHGAFCHVFEVWGKGFRAADFSLGKVRNHGILIHGTRDADHVLIHNLRFVDTGEQMFKVSGPRGASASSDHGVVEWCLFEYSAGVGPRYYIGGIDAHHATHWIIRNNVFRDIRSPSSRPAEHAIHFWSDSSDIVVEKNVITNCDRGIGFGLGDRGVCGTKNIIRNNFVHTTKDVGIGLENATNVKVFNNTVYTEKYFNSIEYRFPGTTGNTVYNNLTNRAIASRTGGSATVLYNVTNAQASWFVDGIRGDLHLGSAKATVVDQGQRLPEVSEDIDCQARPQGRGYDIGADEKVMQ